jgi:hypothetical protein
MLLTVIVLALAVTIPAHAADASVLPTADAEKPASSGSPIATAAQKLKKPPASSKPSARAARRAKPAVWLKLRKVDVAAKVRRGTRVSRIYGRVVRSGRTRRTVVIEVFRHGRWRRAIVTRSRRDGRFSLVRALPASTKKLRAYAPGVGHSPAVPAPVEEAAPVEEPPQGHEEPPKGHEVAATPSGPPTPSGGWSVAYADGFAVPLGTGAGQDNTWEAMENNDGFTNSDEVQVFRKGQAVVGPEGLELRCTYSSTVIANNRHYECGDVSGALCCSLTSTEPAGYHTPVITMGKGQTFAFQAVAKFPPATGDGADVCWWMHGAPWSESEFDFYEAIGNTEGWKNASLYTAWFAPPHPELDKRGFGADPSAAYHTYTVSVFPGSTSGKYRYSVWIDGALQTLEQGAVSAEVTPVVQERLNLVLSYGFRNTGFASGTRTYNVRSAAVYVDSAHQGVGVEDGGLAPGTSISK